MSTQSSVAVFFYIYKHIDTNPVHYQQTITINSNNNKLHGKILSYKNT